MSHIITTLLTSIPVTDTLVTNTLVQRLAHSTGSGPAPRLHSTPVHHHLIGALLLALLLLLTPLAAKGDNFGDTDFLVSGDMLLHNPLVRGGSYSTSLGNQQALSNDDLYRAAEHYRTGNMSGQQRALNHQWLYQLHHDKGVRHGSKVFSKLLKMGFKTYWKDVRKQQFGSIKALPDDKGQGHIVNDINYRLRVSGSKFKLSLNYDF